MMSGVLAAPIQLATAERFRIERVGMPAGVPHGTEFLFASPAHRFQQVRSGKIREELERVGFSVFLSHEKERNVRRQEKQAGRELGGFEVDKLVESLPPGAVAHLIMILDEDDELPGRAERRRGSEAPAARGAIFARVDEALATGLGELVGSSVILAVRRDSSPQKGVHAMLEIVQPLGMQP